MWDFTFSIILWGNIPYYCQQVGDIFRSCRN